MPRSPFRRLKRPTIFPTRPGDLSSLIPSLGLRRPSTCLGEILPKPIWAIRSSTEWKENSFAIDSICSFFIILGNLRLSRSRALSRRVLPKVMLSPLSWFLIHCLIFVFARGVLTNSSQSLLGCCLGDVMISTVCPFLSWYLSGTILLLILAPMHFSPTSEWIL